jgi:ribosomal protein S18 acetylase RimI-like enzyme
MRDKDRLFVRIAGADDVEAIGRLLYDFNEEFGEPSPSAEELAARFSDLLQEDVVVLLGGAGPDGPEGLVVLRFRAAIWTAGLESYLAELYVVPGRRRQGLGRALVQASLVEARSRGGVTMEIGVDEPDLAARGLYESLGFTHHVRGADGPVMFVYEREL